MGKLIEKLVAALSILLVTAFTILVLAFAIGFSLSVKDEIRKDQERTVCKKLGGQYTILEECLAIDGKALVMPRGE